MKKFKEERGFGVLGYYFDGNVIGSNTMLKAKVVEEIVNALNFASIPEYLRTGRLVPL
jgi:hypothetical protein